MSVRLTYSGPEGPRGPSKTRHHPARPDGRGLDLAFHYIELRSIVFGAFTRRCAAALIDPEDLLSAAYEAVLRSNRGAHPYDPSRASVMRYLHLVVASRFAAIASKTAKKLKEADYSELRTLTASSTCPDVGEAVAAILPHVLEVARAADAEDADADGSLVSLFGSASMGWREQAAIWVVHDSVRVTEAAQWWRCSVREATARLDWARDCWREQIVGS